MHDGDRASGSPFRKVLDGSQRYVQELLARSHELRPVAARLEVEEPHPQGQLQSLEPLAARVRQLEGRLVAVERENASLRDVVAAHGRDQVRLQVLMRQVDEENQRYSDEFSHLQRQANSLANLYVALSRLHATLDRRQLVEAIREIVVNLIGSGEMATFELDRGQRQLRLLDAIGIDPAPYGRLPLGRGVIGAALRRGVPVVVEGADERAAGEETLSAVIPLRLADEVNGAIAIFRLLPHKTRFGELDLELFGLLASQAGMALHCTQLHARVEAEETASGSAA